MYMRLAFSVAAHLEPEVLVVDEVLAVGDQEFQKKCLGKMHQVAGEGRTVLFVSHNMDAIRRLCDTCLVLRAGRVQSIGPAAGQVASYLASGLEAEASWLRPRAAEHDLAELFFERIDVLDSRGCISSLVSADESICIELHYAVARPLSACQIAIRVTRDDGLVVLTTGDTDVLAVSAVARQPGQYVARCAIPGHLLAPGRYQCLVAAHAPSRANYDIIDPAVAFEVSAVNSPAALDDRLGIVAPLLHWSSEPLHRQTS
jgi:lipopolysaccharide transport system ATP-binding protein